MTLDEMEQLARNVAAGMLAGSDRTLYVHSSLELARAVLAMLPVVRAAEEWADSDCAANCPRHDDSAHAYDCPERVVIMKLWAAIDQFHTPKGRR